MKITTTEAAKELLAKYETFLFDCDGVIWCGAAPLEGVKEAIKELQDTGKRVLFVSNNSTKDRSEYVAKFAKMGITVKEEEVFSSGYATAKYLESLGSVKKIYMIGQNGLQNELEKVAEVTSDPSDKIYNPDEEAGKDVGPVDAVVVGMDFGFSMVKLARAIVHLRTAKPDGTYPLHVLTNPDAVIPINGKAMPEAAALSAAITANTTQPPSAVCGKPNPLLFSIIEKAFPSISPATTLMVGDRIDTDIRFGQAAGIDTLLVLTGFQKECDVDGSDAKPTYVSEGVADLVSLGTR
eukprot:TRINITY_DN30779_c0_g1_i1.p1 TRINITY_DN30779_c0_g1~~TRINITY_DN30779_c0_g1_i1.p1  ORF type:complete len:311 (+),score=81.07 TRINITY_DN30779_c0_g1_i1:50-934(+)